MRKPVLWAMLTLPACAVADDESQGNAVLQPAPVPQRTVDRRNEVNFAANKNGGIAGEAAYVAVALIQALAGTGGRSR